MNFEVNVYKIEKMKIYFFFYFFFLILVYVAYAYESSADLVLEPTINDVEYSGHLSKELVLPLISAKWQIEKKVGAKGVGIQKFLILFRMPPLP